jgi:hypothetical protein
MRALITAIQTALQSSSDLSYITDANIFISVKVNHLNKN